MVPLLITIALLTLAIGCSYLYIARKVLFIGWYAERVTLKRVRAEIKRHKKKYHKQQARELAESILGVTACLIREGSAHVDDRLIANHFVQLGFEVIELKNSGPGGPFRHPYKIVVPNCSNKEIDDILRGK